MTEARPSRLLLAAAGLNGAIGVAGGALASHGTTLGGIVLNLGFIEVAARYQLIHATALMGVAILIGIAPGRLAWLSGILFTGGCLLFSGGLYVSGILGLGWGSQMAPFGGTSFILGWLTLVGASIGSLRRR